MTDQSQCKVPLAAQRLETIRGSRLLSVALCGLMLRACAVGPDYKRPEAAAPAQYKEAAGWRQAQPSDSLARGAWWELYGDPTLNGLVEKLNSANQTVAQSEAQYRQALALVKSSTGAFFPTVDLSAGKTRSSQGTGSSSSSLSRSSSGILDTYNTQLGVSWEADVWGKLRRGLEANDASAQASFADLAAMRLSQQSSLVQNYLQLRVIDEQKRLLEATVQAYERSLKNTESQYRFGVSGKSAIAQAQFQLAATNSVPALPAIPLGVPSQLLERRPDIASAERSVIAANANIGVAKAAYYPDFTLSLSGGYSSSTFENWITLPNRFWSVGPKLATTLFDGGQRSAEVDRTEAVYDQTVAKYRQTVLDGFREVENYMVQLKVMEDEAAVRAQALDAAREYLRLTDNQYKAGLITYLDVVTVQTTALTNERSVLTLLQSRLIASVQLIAAMGGGWDGNTDLKAKR